MSLSRKRRNTRSSFEDLVHPNFEELAREYPDFGRAWEQVRSHQRAHGGSFASNVTQDFSIATSKALLHTYFSLSLPHIPTLCPPIPNRYFFVKWIQETLLLGGSSGGVGIDLGTGATCIYPLLFCAPEVHIDDAAASGEWKWYASEIDSQSVEMANQNVKANRLESKINVVQLEPTSRQQQQTTAVMEDGTKEESAHAGPLMKLLEALPDTLTHVDIVMTNPPFHDPAQVTEPRGDQRPRTNLTNQEASYPGGEVNFVMDILADSLRLLPSTAGNKPTTLTCKWYASMLGKKTAFNQLHRLLTCILGPARVQSTEFGPGHLTRWFLAWTLDPPNVRSPLALHKSNKKPRAADCRLSFEVALDGGGDVVPQVVDRVATYFRTLTSYKLTVTTEAATTVTLTITETTPHAEEWNNQIVPAGILGVLPSFMEMALPLEGHFLMDVSVQQKTSASATVSLKAYCHSPYGRKSVEKIEAQLQQDVCRTSRKWRRILQRQQQQQQQQPMEEN